MFNDVIDFLKIPALGITGLSISFLIDKEPIEIYRWVVLTATLAGTIYQIYKTHKKK